MRNNLPEELEKLVDDYGETTPENIKKKVMKHEYCTQNNGDCHTCSLNNYGRDCHNNIINHKMTTEEIETDKKQFPWFYEK